MKSINDFVDKDDYYMYLRAYYIGIALGAIADNDEDPEGIGKQAVRIGDATLNAFLEQ